MGELRGHTDAEINTPLIRHMVINAIRSYKNKYGKDYGDIIIACDNKKYWRKQIFPQYKANRKKNRESSGFDWSAIFDALNQIKSELDEHFPYPVIEVESAEADDIIAGLVIWSQENNLIQKGLEFTPQPVLIISGDHDFIQLQRYANVKQYSPMLKSFLKADEAIDSIVMEHILTGDKGDGVPNFLSPDDVFVSGGRQKPIRKKDLEVWKTYPLSYWDNTPHKEFIRRNSQLVDLRNIPMELQEAIINNFTSQIGVKNRAQLLNYFIANKMKNLIEHLEEF